jgi:hypothetical protein
MVGTTYSTEESSAGKSFKTNRRTPFSKVAGMPTEPIHGYILMGNYHLQLETWQANRSRAMQRLNLSYGAVNAAIARFERRLKIDRDLQKKLKKIAN